MKEYTLLMLAHMLGDYYFQPQCLAKLKSRNTLYVLIHAGIYAAVMFSTLLLCYSNAYLYAVAACAVTHAVIDIVKQLILNGAAKRGSLTVKQDRAAYLIDQALHLSIILAVSFASAFYGEGRGIEFLQNDIKALVGIDGFAMLSILTMLLAVLKPANVFVQKVLVTEKPDEKVKTRLKQTGKMLPRFELPNLISAMSKVMKSCRPALIRFCNALKQHSIFVNRVSRSLQ